MDFATHSTAAVNGLDILLWVGFLYLVPRLLRWTPRKRVRVRRMQEARPLLVKQADLRVA